MEEVCQSERKTRNIEQPHPLVGKVQWSACEGALQDRLREVASARRDSRRLRGAASGGGQAQEKKREHVKSRGNLSATFTSRFTERLDGGETRGGGTCHPIKPATAKRADHRLHGRVQMRRTTFFAGVVAWRIEVGRCQPQQQLLR